jgi:hypothetical protein
MAARYVSADKMGVPIVHPYRWAGSWHTKEQPVQAQIVGGNPDSEIMPYDALAALRNVVDEPPEHNPVIGTPALCTELSAYGAAALRRATENILNAPDGRQESTLSWEALSIGTLAGAAGVPPGIALEVLIDAAKGLINYDPRRPWQAGQAEQKVRLKFGEGLRKPRPSEADKQAAIDAALEEANDMTADEWAEARHV